MPPHTRRRIVDGIASIATSQHQCALGDGQDRQNYQAPSEIVHQHHGWEVQVRNVRGNQCLQRRQLVAHSHASDNNTMLCACSIEPSIEPVSERVSEYLQASRLDGILVSVVQAFLITRKFEEHAIGQVSTAMHSIAQLVYEMSVLLGCVRMCSAMQCACVAWQRTFRHRQYHRHRSMVECAF
jgi:hypothetical protein